MNTSKNQIECSEHGSSETTYVCPHILQSAKDKDPRGFHWHTDDQHDIQAFCDQCWNASDEEWEELRKEGCRLLCLECLKAAATLNEVEMELSDLM